MSIYISICEISQIAVNLCILLCILTLIIKKISPKKYLQVLNVNLFSFLKCLYV